MKTDFAGLALTDRSESAMTFVEWRTLINGTDRSSNMQLIDNALAKLDAAMSQLRSEVNDIQSDMRYVPINITSVNNSIETAELGRTIEAVTITVQCNRTPMSLTINGKDISFATGTTKFSTTLTEQSIRSDTSWRIVATDERGGTDIATTSITFLGGVYYGALPYGTDMTSGVMLGLAKRLQDSRSLTFTVDPRGNRPIFAIPVQYGTPTFTINGFTYVWENVATFDFTNASGHMESYSVWMHGQDVNESVDITVTWGGRNGTKNI